MSDSDTLLREERAIVDRVWRALGISTYDEAKPLAIDEHVANLKREQAELIGALRDAHTAMDQLFAMLIVANETFRPSKSVMWPTILKISSLLAKHAPKATP